MGPAYGLRSIGLFRLEKTFKIIEPNQGLSPRVHHPPTVPQERVSGVQMQHRRVQQKQKLLCHPPIQQLGAHWEGSLLPGTMGPHCFCQPPIFSLLCTQCAAGCFTPFSAGHTRPQCWVSCPWCHLCTWHPGADKHWGGNIWLSELCAWFTGISSSRSDLVFLSLLPAHQQRSHPRGEEGVCLPLAGLHTGAEALQGSVYVGGAHAKAHRRKATQVHGELAGTHGASAWRVGHRAGVVTKMCLGMASGRLYQPDTGSSSELCLGNSYLQVRPWGQDKRSGSVVEVLVGKTAFPWEELFQIYHRDPKQHRTSHLRWKNSQFSCLHPRRKSSNATVWGAA